MNALTNMSKDDLTERNLPGPLPPGAAEKLGYYVYALRDPRDRTIFYIGKGTGDRVYSHVLAAMGRKDRIQNGVEKDAAVVLSAKNARIQEIYALGLKVEHFILAPNIESDSAEKTAFTVEQALIDAFRVIAQPDLHPPVLTNIAGGHKKAGMKELNADELIRQLAAEEAPELPRPSVILISRNVMTPNWTVDEIYEAIKGSWTARKIAHLADLPVFVVHRDIVRAVFIATKWTRHPDYHTVWDFERGSDSLNLHDLYVNKSVKHIRLARSDKNWQQRGWNPYL